MTQPAQHPNLGQRPWLAHYPELVPQEINPARLVPLNALIERACRDFPDRPAFESFSKSLTYRNWNWRRALLQHGCKRRASGPVIASA
jgi:long-chain acyl-CoA synthetase